MSSRKPRKNGPHHRLKTRYLSGFGLADIGLQFVIFAIVAWVLFWLLAGDSVRYLGFVNAGGLVFGYSALGIGLVLLIRRRWITSISAFILAFVLIIWPSGTNIAASEARIAASDLRVLSASLRGLNRDMKRTAEHLARYDADILGLQEVYDPAAFKTSLEAASGRQWYMVFEGKLVVLSAYPVSKDTKPLNSVLATTIALPGRDLGVWTLRAPKAYDKPLINRQFFQDLSTSIATAQPDAVIGDFNASPWNHGYAVMTRMMKNAQKSAGFGPGSSFPGPGRSSGLLGAFARIDHVFVKPQIHVSNAFTGQAYQESDHHPVIADIRIAKIRKDQR